MTKQALLRALREHLSDDLLSAEVDSARQNFARYGYAKVPFLAPDVVKSAVGSDADALIAARGVRRDLHFAETDFSPRHMRNVSRAEIVRNGSFIKHLYTAKALLKTLALIADEPVHVCPYEPEQFVITYLEKNGDTHGWHWDDYSFALVWVIETPPVHNGGFVQCVPDTAWNKARPEINKMFTTRPIYSIELLPGDLYLMRTNTTLHRVYPIKNGRRKIVNMGYASTADLTRSFSHETMDSLWSAVPGAVAS
jgi:hypothetical protein